MNGEMNQFLVNLNDVEELPTTESPVYVVVGDRVIVVCKDKLDK